jgi:hypothetical protein
MKTIVKLSKLALVASVGTVLWTGCSTDSSMYSGAESGSSMFASAPLDQTKRRPDTHPESRTGLWQVTYNSADRANSYAVVEAPAVQTDEPGADTTSLLAFNQEAINAASAAGFGPVIEEAAGARSFRQDRRMESETDRSNSNLDAERNNSGTDVKSETKSSVNGTEIKTETTTKTEIESK